MIIKNCSWYFSRINKRYFLFVKNPGDEIVDNGGLCRGTVYSQDRSQYSDYSQYSNRFDSYHSETESQNCVPSFIAEFVCQNSINPSYVEAQHFDLENIMIIVAENISKNEVNNEITISSDDLLGIAYVTKIFNNEFRSHHKIKNTSTPPLVNEELRTFKNSLSSVIDNVDQYLKSYKKKMQAIFSKEADFLALMAFLQKKTYWSLWPRIIGFLDRIRKTDMESSYEPEAHKYLLDMGIKYWQPEGKDGDYCYVHLICSKEKTGSGKMILDVLEKMDYTLQRERLGFVYQKIALEGIYDAYDYYADKAKFVRSLDGINYFPPKPIQKYFKGESNGYIFTKHVSVPYLPALEQSDPLIVNEPVPPTSGLPRQQSWRR